ncbi:MAG: hypothetical protein DCF12_12255 [Snowella sp.]|nr:MAG: hypothetical protein DCF12_12255 [Snowella sp.]
MKYFYLFLVNVLGSLLVSYPTQAQTLKIPNFARPTVTTPQINLPTSRPNITTPKVSAPTLTPQTSVSFPTTTTTITVPSFPNVNNLGDRLIQSPQTINFPSQKLPTQFLPASITIPNNLNSTLPLNLIVPQFPNATATVNQLQLVPTLINFPKQTPQISIPSLSTFTATPQPTVSTDLFDNTPSVAPSFGLQLELVTPTGTITKTDFTPLTLDERGIVTNGGLFNRTLD